MIFNGKDYASELSADNSGYERLFSSESWQVVFGDEAIVSKYRMLTECRHDRCPPTFTCSQAIMEGHVSSGFDSEA
jgi:hypothetical protein